MATQHRRGVKLPTRDREGTNTGVVIRCACGKRLADLSITTGYRDETTDGVEFVRFQEAARWPGGPMAAQHGIKDIANEDWQRVVCTKCGRDHRVRDRDLVALIRDAQSRNAREATLNFSEGKRLRTSGGTGRFSGGTGRI
jgi:hypothetical protein